MGTATPTSGLEDVSLDNQEWKNSTTPVVTNGQHPSRFDVEAGPVPAKKQANGTRFSAGTQPPSASPTAGSGPGAALISDHDMAIWSRRARDFIAFSIVVSLVAGVIALVAGAIVSSAALVAYGLESFVDLWASVLVLWRFWEDETTEAGMRKNHDRENRADVGIAFTFILISVITAADAIDHLAKHKTPDDSTSILVLSAVSIVVLTAMGVYKIYLNKYLDSKALEQDAVASFSVTALSIGVLVSAALYQVNERIWWLDAVVALVVTIGLAVYSIPVLIKHPWWRRDFWRAYTGQ